MDSGNNYSLSYDFVASDLSKGSNSLSLPSPAGYEVETNLELLSLNRLSYSLEKLLLEAEYDHSDAVIEVEGTPVGVNRCILAARSPFFHELFKNGNGCSVKESKPKYLMSKLVPHYRIGLEAFNVLLTYLYTAKLKPSPPEVSTCVDESCTHDSCPPAINYAVELMYGSATFQIKELVMLVQRRLIDFVDKAFSEDIIPILAVAFHCQLEQLLSYCVNRLVHSDLDEIVLEKELPHEVLSDIQSLRFESQKAGEHALVSVDPMNEKRIGRIHKALDSNDVELVKLLLEESSITLDAAHALHYAAAFCNYKVVNEVLNLGNADVNLRNCRGYTVLHVAARRKDPSVIVGLLNQGASVSDTTNDGQTAVKICRRLTRPKDYNEATKEGHETNKDRLCIDVLEREMLGNPLADYMSMSSMMVPDDLHMNLLLFENRVAMARALFPLEAKLAMQLAHADSTSEFAGLSASKGTYGDFREVDLNEIPSEQFKRLQLRLLSLQKTVETARRFFPNCTVVLDKLLEDDNIGALLLEKGTPEEQRMKRMRYMELKEDVMKAFSKDIAENNWTNISSSSSCSSSPRMGKIHKVRKKNCY
ncbi:BTB/POZ domain and ankyrin repeat-containing protein NPR2-like isoform X2 [Olea europaea var. sylvestris]|uniref:BTB/POZ domain and ankyrin repeat-containing protein NPR2-like isoform X2 n=1 Tax=Olea europaea var. sylvestris TaxID=158386 RepID=UPI000C1D2511|nr:BTB/POZ domain and ankyrin repeat-containing protein NPR2-like isoform X2 [Olea europaea var. sylvestris]